MFGSDFDVIAFLALIVAIVGLLSTGFWYVMRLNTQRTLARHQEYREEIKQISETFQDGLRTITQDHKAEMRQLAEDNRQTYKELSTQLHHRISEQATTAHDFQLHVATNYPQRQEMSEKIASAIDPLIREMKGLGSQMSELNASVKSALERSK